VTAIVANGPGTPGDWVGLYDANGNNVAWRYLNGTQTLPATGTANADVTFTLPTTTGTFTVRLFNAQYVWIATSQPVTTTVPTVTVNTTAAAPGQVVTATVANGPGTPGDWVGLYDEAGNPVQWEYLDGTQTLPTVGIGNAEVTFTIPQATGTYQVRFFNASYMLVATSAAVAVN
jgi:type 1 glutamine amidotransferase